MPNCWSTWKKHLSGSRISHVFTFSVCVSLQASPLRNRRQPLEAHTGGGRWSFRCGFVWGARMDCRTGHANQVYVHSFERLAGPAAKAYPRKEMGQYQEGRPHASPGPRAPTAPLVPPLPPASLSTGPQFPWQQFQPLPAASKQQHRPDPSSRDDEEDAYDRNPPLHNHYLQVGCGPLAVGGWIISQIFGCNISCVMSSQRSCIYVP